MTALSLNRVLHGRVLSDQRVRSMVFSLVENNGLSLQQGEMLVDLAKRFVSIRRAISLPREKAARQLKLSEELDSIFALAEREGEPFREVFLSLIPSIEREVLNVSL